MQWSDMLEWYRVCKVCLVDRIVCLYVNSHDLIFFVAALSVVSSTVSYGYTCIRPHLLHLFHFTARITPPEEQQTKLWWNSMMEGGLCSHTHKPCVHWIDYEHVTDIVLCVKYRTFHMGRVAQSLQQLTTGWTVRERIPVGTRFSAHPHWPLGPTQPPVKWVPGLSWGWSAAVACCWPLAPF
jgi:hypothetical protein